MFGVLSLAFSRVLRLTWLETKPPNTASQALLKGPWDLVARVINKVTVLIIPYNTNEDTSILTKTPDPLSSLITKALNPKPQTVIRGFFSGFRAVFAALCLKPWCPRCRVGTAPGS